MSPKTKTKQQLVQELERLQARVAALEKTHADPAAAALQAERRLTSAVLDTLDALVVVLDRQGRIVRFNRACERTTGYTFEEIAGKLFWEMLLIPEEVEPVKEVFRELRAGDFPNKYENYWTTKSGGQRLIAWSNTAIPDHEDEVVYIVGTGIDITEQKRAEEALLAERTRISMELHDSVIQSLYAIGLQIDSMETGEDEQPEGLHSIAGAIDRAIKDIRQYILDLDASNPHSPTIQDCLVNEVLPRLHIPESTTVELHMPDLPLPTPPNMVDGICLMANEAISNAVRHAEPSRITITGQLVDDTIQIIVADDGLGFDPDTAAQGDGLGLRNLQQRAKLYGGRVRIDASPGGGTSVTISIPTLVQTDTLNHSASP
jgi:PAS domain S-box-containing protein